MNVFLYDLETYPFLGYFWGDNLYEQAIIDIKEKGGLLGFGYMWAHEEKVRWVGLPDNPKYKKGNLDDKWLTQQLYDLISQADYYVAHNGKSFDNRVSNTAFLKHKMPPPHKPVAHDTKQLFKTHFRLPSNKLDEIGAYLEIGRKVPHTGKKLWFDCMEGDPKAWKLMEKYCVQDVLLLKEIWDTIKPWMNNPPNWNLDGDRPKCCPACGYPVFKPESTSTTDTTKRQMYRCQRSTCKHKWRGEVIQRFTRDFKSQ